MQIEGRGKSKTTKKEATIAIPTEEPILPYFDISNDPYFTKS